MRSVISIELHAPAQRESTAGSKGECDCKTDAEYAQTLVQHTANFAETCRRNQTFLQTSEGMNGTSARSFESKKATPPPPGGRTLHPKQIAVATSEQRSRRTSPLSARRSLTEKSPFKEQQLNRRETNPLERHGHVLTEELSNPKRKLSLGRDQDQLHSSASMKREIKNKEFWAKNCGHRGRVIIMFSPFVSAAGSLSNVGMRCKMMQKRMPPTLLDSPLDVSAPPESNRGRQPRV